MLVTLQRLAVKTVGDLAALGEPTLIAALGRATGRHLYELSNAIDERPVERSRAAKSIGHEETFAHDLYDRAEMRTEVVRLSDAVASRLRASGLGARTLTIKIRFHGFETITRSVTAPAPVATAAAIINVIDPLLKAIDPGRGVRLIGVHASNFGQAVEQMSLLDALQAPDSSGSTEVSAHDWVEATSAIDAIRDRFGTDAIGPASAVTKRGIRLVRKGAQQWGPDHDGSGRSQ